MEKLTAEEIKSGRLAYEKDRREHLHDAPHWEEISHSERLHWIFMCKPKPQGNTPPAPTGLVVVL